MDDARAGCMDCGSALAEAEVEYEDKQSHAVDVAFAVRDTAEFAKRAGLAQAPASADFVIWTTTPWTLPANQAVSLHPELEYVVVQAAIDGQTRTLVLAKTLADGGSVVFQPAIRISYPSAVQRITSKAVLPGLWVVHLVNRFLFGCFGGRSAGCEKHAGE